ncbi:heme-containing dehydratase domain-containing protein [Rutstroemia sp. NJR-2017a BVV2]|nr:heme-containing dehydratase domain-containing protein [Rutstroemia sp. NJR-2017a BVV2]
MALRNGLMIRQGVLRDPSFDDVRLGRYSTQIPFPDGSTSPTPSDQQVVLHSVDGRFAPGLAEAGKQFGEMWREFNNREKWGSFIDLMSGVIRSRQNLYKDLEHLQAFSQAPLHRKVWEDFNWAKNPHFSIMHETYVAPKGNWETIYWNFKPVGFGQMKHLTDESKVNGTTVTSLREVNGATWKSMKSRMGMKNA